jgi:RHS repeat-associated protein
MKVRRGQLFGLLVMSLLVLNLPSPAQTSYLQQIGLPPTDATVPVELGSIDLTNGNLHLEVPIASFPQRGGQGFEAKMVYDSRIWLGAYWGTTSGVWSYRPINVGDGHGNPSMGGWRMVINHDNTASGWGATPVNGACNNELGANSFNRLTAFAWQGPDGAVHTWQSLYTEQDFGTQTCPDAFGDTSATAGYADDGSGFYLLVTNYQNLTVWGPDGNQVYPIFKDTNGNYFSNDASGNVIDTLGRVPIIKTSSGNNIFYDVLNAQGTHSRYTVTTESIAVSVPNYATTLTVVQSITLPNGTNYQFSYDSGGSGDNWGGITSVTLPTGGQVTYGYTTYVDAWNYVASTNRWVTSRISAGETWHYTPAVIGSTLATADQQTTVKKPSGDYAIYKFHADCQLGPFKNKEIDAYNAGGALLKQELIDFSPDFCNAPGSESRPVEVASIPIRITTLINGSSGSLTTKTEYDYTNSPSAGNPTKVSEWNFYTGTAPTTPDRIIISTYSFSVPSYSNLHINNKPFSITLTDGANHQIAQTSYTYDSYTGNQLASTAVCQSTSSSQPPPAAPQHDYQAFCTTNTARGNLTQVSQWLNTTGATVTTTNTFDDTGNIIKTADALSHATQFTYSPTFGLAYVTQITNALGHIRTKNYDFNTGLVLSEKDPNGQVTGLSIKYVYDNMGRITETTVPDGGHVTVDYHGDAVPLSVTTTQTATPNPSIGTTINYDGYGRAKKQCVTDTEGDDCVDTEYDLNGRISSVSNPHRTVAAASDGVTSFGYDGLDRQISVTHPDQNVVNNGYDIQTSPTMGQVVLATDETLRQRRTVTDGFARLVEADEPGDSSSGAQASGTIDIRQVKTAQVGGTQLSSASAQVTISGTDSCQTIVTRCTAQQIKFGCEPSSTTTCATGKVYISINGREYDYLFGNGGSAPDSAASVAQNLVSVIQSDASRIVNASISPSSTNIVVVTAATAGSAGNSISFASGSSNNFGTSPTSGQLVGGQDAVGSTTVTDHGTVTMTAGAFTTPSIAYGPGTANITAAMAATALANALSTPGSGVSASTNGGTLITITETSVGVSGNGVPISVHPTSADPTDFPSASFSVAPTTLAGGVDPYSSGVAHPYVSRYFYDLLDNLTCVEQHGNSTGSGCTPTIMAITDNQPPAADASSPWRIRRFAYDSLGRLRWANDPESGLTSTQYDNDGNPTSIVDARGVTATLGYDQLHRLTTKSFSDGTGATFVYDLSSVWGVTPTNPIGRLVLQSTNNAANLFSYDPVGRPLIVWDCTPKNMSDQTGCYTVQAQYDLAGDLKQLIYPSGRKLIYSYNSSGHFTKANFDSFNGVNVNFAYYNSPAGTGPANWGYWPTGAMHTGIFGNGVQQTLGVNARTQVNVVTQATTSQTLLSKSYGLYDASSHNNGDILSISDGLSSGRNQNYSYDSLNRIASGSQADGTFNVTFNYDSWGNMQESGTANFQPLFDNKNRIAVAAGCTSATSYCSDPAGDILNDGFHQYTYDAEGRMKTVDGTGVTYTYDPGGQRVRKDAGTTATEFIYFNGEVIAENNPATGTWTDYIFAYGMRVAKDTSTNGSGAQYFHADQIGSTRLITDNTGTAIWQATYNPFGQELSPQNTGIRFQYAGMEYDTESNLNHTDFRQYASSEGRWLRPDPYLGGLDLSNPQSLNRYVYVLNNPLIMNDAKGLMPGCDPNEAECEGDAILGKGGKKKKDAPGPCSSTGEGGLPPCPPKPGPKLDGSLAPNPPGFGPPGSHPRNVCGYTINGIYFDCGNSIPRRKPGENPEFDAVAAQLAHLVDPKALAEDQKDAWKKGYYGCIGNDVIPFKGLAAAAAAKGVEEAATHAAEHGGSKAAGIYYHFTDGRFTAWGRQSKVLVPKAAGNIAKVAKGVSVAGWILTDVELAHGIYECVPVLGGGKAD